MLDFTELTRGNHGEMRLKRKAAGGDGGNGNMWASTVGEEGREPVTEGGSGEPPIKPEGNVASVVDGAAGETAVER